MDSLTTKLDSLACASLAVACALLLPNAALAQSEPDAGTQFGDAAAPMPPAPTAEQLAALEARLHTLEVERATTRPPPAPAASRAATPSASSLDFAPAVTPFAFADFSWAPGSYAPADTPLHWGPFSGEIRGDVAFHHAFSAPVDNTISGSSEAFRSNEFQLTQLGVGGDFYYKGVQLRLMTQFGMYSQTTPRNDASPGRGQWNLADAYRYLSEAYVGYHLDVMAGINIQAGIFMSYVGLWSYYNFDNWTYQPSYVSSNTPWFFNGARVQIHPDDHLKIETWLVNGWQAYGQFNQAPGIGLQVRWSPTGWFSILGNQYYGTDTLGVPGRMRLHTDDSVMVRFYDRPTGALSRVAGSLTLDAGCEFGDGAGSAPAVACSGQYFLGFMAYARVWFFHDVFGLTVGGGAITNPGRYLVLLPPINGATAFSGTPYFTESPGDPYNAWDVQTTFDFMPTRNLTFRVEYTHRAADVPYFTGHGGVTPPGGNNGAPSTPIPGWTPDLVPTEDRTTFAALVRL